MMKKFVAGAMAAAMVMSSSAVCFAEGEVLETAEVMESAAEEAAYTGLQMDVDYQVEVEGQQFSGKTSVTSDAEQDEAFSMFLSVPGEEGAVTEINVEDYCRIVDGDLYVNVDAVKGFLESAAGEEASSITSMLPMLGLTESWLKVPKLNVVLNQDAVNTLSQLMSLTPSEELMASIQGLAEPFTPQETETSYILVVNNEVLVAAADKVDELIANNKEEISTYLSLLNPKDILNIFDIEATFGEYIDAYANGRTSVTGEDTAAVKQEIIDFVPNMIDTLLEQAGLSSLPDFAALLDEMPDLSDLLTSMLEGTTIDGKLEVAKDFTMIDGNVDVASGEDTYNFNVHSAAAEDGSVAAVATATQNGAELAKSECNITFGENDFNISGNVSEQGQEVALYNVAGNQGEDGSINITGELQTLVTDENGASAMAPTASCTLNAAPTENGMAGTLTVNADGQTVLVDFATEIAEEAQTFTATVSMGEGEESTQIAGVSFSLLPTYDDMEGNTAVFAFNAMGYDGGFVLCINDAMDQFHFESNAGQGEARLFNMIIDGTLTAAPEGTDITAPEASNSIFEVITNVTALYYSMQASEMETEMASEEVTE